MRFRTLAMLLVGAITLGGAAGCGGTYASTGGFGGHDRGDTNGRMFDFVSTMPDGDQWDIRIRGSSMWVAYSLDDSEEELGSTNLSATEARELWALIDALDVEHRRTGELDKENGSLLLRLREPGERDHEIYAVYVSREAESDKVIELADYLAKLVKRHHREKPTF